MLEWCRPNMTMGLELFDNFRYSSYQYGIMDNGATSGISVMVNDMRLMINVYVVLSYEAGVRVI